MKEKPVEDHLRDRVKALGGLAIKVMPVSMAGLPDRLVLLPGGRAYFVEVKRPRGGVVSPIQKVVHGKLEKMGHPVALLNTKEGIDEWLSAVFPTVAGK